MIRCVRDTGCPSDYVIGPDRVGGGGASGCVSEGPVFGNFYHVINGALICIAYEMSSGEIAFLS